MTNHYEDPRETERYRSPVRAESGLGRRNLALVMALAAFALGILICYWEYERQRSPSWLLNWRFNLGLLSMTFGIALFVGWRFSRKVGFIVVAVLLANIWFWLWTFIGRLIIDEFIY